MAIAIITLLVIVTFVSNTDADVDIYEEISKIKTQLSVLAADYALKSTVPELQKALEAANKKIVLDRHVYFKATFPDLVAAVGEGTVVFNKVQDNTGSAYNLSNGIFTAPFRGLYVFVVQPFIKDNGIANWDLHVNGQMVLRSLFGSQHHYSNAYTYPLTLQGGDRVSVYSRNSLNIWGIDHSIFAGWLIKAF